MDTMKTYLEDLKKIPEPLPNTKPVKQRKNVHNICKDDHMETADDNIENTEDMEGTEDIDIDTHNNNISQTICDIDNGDKCVDLETIFAKESALGTEMDIDGAVMSNNVPANEIAAPAGTSNLPEIHDLSSHNSNVLTVIPSEISRMFVPPVNVLTLERQSKPPYKGVMVPCGQLKDYLDCLPTFNRKCMLRKGREVHKIYVDMTKGETFLDDQFSYTEFGKMVLTNGSIRAGRAKNAKQIVVARETLYCSGTTACKRACGGYGICLTACDKTKMRGHRCSYRIKLTQRLGFVNFWFVEELGSHDQLNGKDCDFKTNSQIAEVANKVTAAIDLNNGLKMKIRTTNISKAPRKMAKLKSSPSPERPQVDGATTDYHYVLGLMPSSSPASESAIQITPCSAEPQQENISVSPSQVQQHAFDMYNELTAQALAASIPPMNTDILSSQLHSVTQGMHVNLINYMSNISNLGISAIGSPLIVNVKQEPQSDFQSKNHCQLLYPLVTVPSQIKSSPSHMSSPSQITKSHSPSPSRVQCQRERSLEKSPFSGIQKGLEIEEKIKQESTNNCQMQAQKEVLGQVHNRIMERAKSRKSSHTLRVLPKDTSVLDKNDMPVIDLTNIKSDVEIHRSPISNIPQSHSSTNISSSDANFISSLAFHRFQTLNQVLQSEAFQAAKIQFEKKKAVSAENCLVQQDKALNLSVKANFDVKTETGISSQQNYFKLAEEWKKEEQLIGGWKKVGEIPEELKKQEKLTSSRKNLEAPHQEWKRNGQIIGSCWKNEQIPEALKMTVGECKQGDKDIVSQGLLNGYGDVPFLNNGPEAAVNSHELTDNEKELMCRVRQLESHVKQLQNIVIKREVSTTLPLTGRKHKKPQRLLDFSKYNTRHVALKIMYIGTGYSGYIGLEPTDNTIEKVLFEALRKTQLIENKEAAFYSKCGQTDKGVSAFGQMIEILSENPNLPIVEKDCPRRYCDKNAEIRYCHMLNKVLPPEVRVLAWAPVDVEFSARFRCKKMTYKYFFPQGNLNIKVMNEASQRFIGEHDFRNICKINVNNFVRRIYSAEVKVTDHKEGGYSMCEFTITATEFLWHQIRCILTVLILIGQGSEKPEVIDELMDVDKTPRRPEFNIAADFPLCLFEADYGDELDWIYEPEWHEDNIKILQQLWAENSIKACMLKRMLEDLDQTKVETECDIAPWSDLSPPLLHQAALLLSGSKHKPSMENQTYESVEYKHEQAVKQRKLNSGADNVCPGVVNGE